MKSFDERRTRIAARLRPRRRLARRHAERRGSFPAKERAALLDAIDAAAKERGLSRSVFLASAAREKIMAGA
ncbi:MAG TPA: hypothetical protein VKG91_13395 [Roseiarcus sp.]|nr:hypothetical protein [Roseiarcus sp.]